MAFNKIADNNSTYPLTLNTLKVDGTLTSSGTGVFTGGTQSTVSLIARQSQTATGQDIQQWQQADGFVFGRVNAQGEFYMGQNGATMRIGANTGMGGSLTIGASGPTYIGLSIRAAAAHTANLTEWQNSAGTVIASIGASGIPTFTRATFVNDTATDGVGLQVKRTFLQFGTVATETGAIIRGAASQTGDLQQWQDSTNAVLSRVDNLGKIILPGNTTIFDYALSTDGSTDLTWKKFIELTMPTGLYTGATYEIDVYDQMENYGILSATPNILHYSVKVQRSGGTQDDVLAAVVLGPSSDYVRVVKVSSSLYEIQIRQTDVYRVHIFKAKRIGQNNTSETYTPAGKTFTSLAAGNTTGTIYTAVNNSATYANFTNEYFSHLNANKLTVQPLGTLSTPTAIIKGAATQTQNLQEWQDSTGSAKAYVTQDGSVLTAATLTTMANLRVAGLAATGGGVGVIGITNAGTVPTSNPTGGGVLYVDTGALKYMGTSGTAATIVNANGTMAGGVSTSVTNNWSALQNFNGGISASYLSLQNTTGWRESYLASNVTMTNANTFYIGPSVSMVAGRWLISGNIVVASPANTAMRVTARFGNSVVGYLAGAEMTMPAMGAGVQGLVTIPINVIFDTGASGTQTLGIEVASTTAGCTIVNAPIDNGASVAGSTTYFSAIRV